MTTPDRPLSVALLGPDGPGAAELAQALRDAGLEVRRPAHPDDPVAADVVLVPAAVGRLELLRLRRLLSAGDDPPTLILFGPDPAAVERHAVAGFDYLVAPFRAALVRHRLTASRDRDRLGRVARGSGRPVPPAAYERQLRVGGEIQRGFLPDRLPATGDWQLAARTQPAWELGGDFYDAFEVDSGRRMAFVVADVCDKGVGAALFVASIRALLRQAAEQAVPGQDAARDLLGWVRQTNGYLLRNHLDQAYFTSMFVGVVAPRTGMLCYVNAGHVPAVLRRDDGRLELLPRTGPVLGVFPSGLQSVRQAELGRGDLLLVVSDGVTEARDRQGQPLGDDRVRWLVQAVREDSPPRLLERLDRLVRLHAADAPQHDDITMLALQRPRAS